MASFVSSTQRGIRRCLASGWSDTGSVLSVEASTLKSADLQRMGDPLDLSYPKLTDI